MENYQRATEAMRYGDEYPLQLLKNVGMTAIGGGAAKLGSKAMGKIIPAVGALINEHVPENLSIAGLSKVDPRFKSFIKNAMDSGYTYDDVRNFLGEKIQKSKESEETAQPEQKTKKGQGNLIQQYDPELHEYMMMKLKEGMSAKDAAQKSTQHTRFNRAISKMTKDQKRPWMEIVSEIYGSQPGNQQEGIQPQQETKQQPGPGEAALMEILQKIHRSRGGQ